MIFCLYWKDTAHTRAKLPVGVTEIDKGRHGAWTKVSADIEWDEAIAMFPDAVVSVVCEGS